MRETLAVFALILVLSPIGYAQVPPEIGSRRAIPLPFSLLIPEGIRLGYDMRNYIASPEFGAFDSSVSSEATFNEIYFEALELAHGDVSNALLAAAFGSFEHEYIPLDILGIRIDLPLTSETHARFELRWSHFPAYLYHTKELDRDKLQHFFASAWLKSTLGMDWLVRLAGQAVETGEDLFVVGGFVDPRDLHANGDGILFAIQAERSLNSRPSKSLTPNP
ncbi:MAG TPA: hypothetical protein VFD13_00550 [Candidatus Kapabacteria bacterium]|nr:hypothetical protein [Candidatus Kapabacteria bacterium]